MVVIVDIVTSKNENGSDDTDEVIVKAAKRIERDIKDLLRQVVYSDIARRSLIVNYMLQHAEDDQRGLG